jgi:Short C-terminal domain
MMRRMGRPGLVGTMARTAVVAGTATAVSGSVRNSQQAKAQAAQNEQQAAAESQAELAAMQQQMAQLQAQQAAAAAPAPAPAAAPAAAGSIDIVGELTKLADLKAAGVLSDAEFEAAKAKLLA